MQFVIDNFRYIKDKLFLLYNIASDESYILYKAKEEGMISWTGSDRNLILAWDRAITIIYNSKDIHKVASHYQEDYIYLFLS